MARRQTFRGENSMHRTLDSHVLGRRVGRARKMQENNYGVKKEIFCPQKAVESWLLFCQGQKTFYCCVHTPKSSHDGRFQNTACNGTNSLTGTCYTLEECLGRGGANVGTCASGFGTCCVSKSVRCTSLTMYPCLILLHFTASLTCGGMSSENCTYFNSDTAAMAGACTATICPCGDNICQVGGGLPARETTSCNYSDAHKDILC